jgi:hypothetical protein
MGFQPVPNFAACRRNLLSADRLEAQRALRFACVGRERLGRMLNVRSRVAAAWKALGTG